MNITEDQLFDYIKCPAFYDMKYNKNFKTEEYKSVNEFLKPVANFYFTSIFNKRVPSGAELKGKWDTICRKNPIHIDTKKNIEGMGLLINLERWGNNNKLYLAEFNTGYTVKIGDIEVRGTIGPVQATMDKQLILIDPKFVARCPEQSEIDRKLKYTLDCLAFKEAYKHEINAIKVVHIKNLVEMYTTRDRLDFDRLESTVKGVVNGIESDVYYPRETSFCNSCSLKQYCKYWT